MTTRTRRPALAVAAILAAVADCAGGGAHADVNRGGTPVKNRHHPVHGAGSSHNPIVRHGPLHGAGSSHNPIVVPRDCNEPNTLCRRP